MSSLPKGMNEHYGQNVKEMPKILRAGEMPVSVAGLMKNRLEQGSQFSDLWNKYWDTSDLVIYPKGNNDNIYVLLTTDNKGNITENGNQALQLIRSDNLTTNYGAVVERLSDLGKKGLVKIPRKDIKTDTYFNQEQIQDQRLWRVLARDPNEVAKAFAEDENLLKEYSAEVQKRTGNNSNMALYLGNSLDDKTTLKAWYVYRLGDRSSASGRGSLADADGRFLGIAPEALSAQGKGTSKELLYTPQQITSALKELGFSGLNKTLIDKLNQ